MFNQRAHEHWTLLSTREKYEELWRLLIVPCLLAFVPSPLARRFLGDYGDQADRRMQDNESLNWDLIILILNQGMCLSHFHDDEPGLADWLIRSGIVKTDSGDCKTTTSQVRHPQNVPYVPSIKDLVAHSPAE